ncbi:hypothetical protein KPH14_001845 [Odynerus spinipes]|uniref:Uncharacterized protein n=1 Tax=Odynerus spinipes TaxID=1348599 RepID=A0AAD9S1X4_9HYME|nr:hypothetical protein KPH14_001845 [Odynerus spinipes]
MKEVKSVLFSTICLMTVTSALTQSELRPKNIKSLVNETRYLDLYSGVRLYVNGRQIWINVRIPDLFEENVKGRGDSSDDEQTKEPHPMKKFGFMMMMAPFAMQLISLPGALASIKVSLLRSIFVAKLAIIIMIYNMIKNIQPSEVVVVQQQAQHHQHYYNSLHEAEYDDQGWFGR